MGKRGFMMVEYLIVAAVALTVVSGILVMANGNGKETSSRANIFISQLVQDTLPNIKK